MEVNIYIGFWTLKLKCTQYGICGQNAKRKGNGFFEIGRANNNFWFGPKNIDFLDKLLPLPESTPPKKFVGEV